MHPNQGLPPHLRVTSFDGASSLTCVHPELGELSLHLGAFLGSGSSGAVYETRTAPGCAFFPPTLACKILSPLGLRSPLSPAALCR